jgi:hypothetical protein
VPQFWNNPAVASGPAQLAALLQQPELWYKLTLAPSLVAVATLLGRRYGQLAAGLVAGLPIVAGPILYFYAKEQGLDFAAAAAQTTLLGIVSLSLFTVAYAWRAWSGGSVLSSLILGWVAFALGTVVINRLLATHRPSLVEALCFGVGSLFLAIRSLPPAQDGSPRVAVVPPMWDLPLRLFATALLIFLLTYFAQTLGPILGGLLAPFPIASTVLTVFAHSQGGSEAARSVLKGLLLALNAFAVFCAVLAVGLAPLGLAPAFAVALLAAAAAQAAMVYWQLKQQG